MTRFSTPTEWAQSWAPFTAAVGVLVLASGIAIALWRRGGALCPVSSEAAGTAFLFGAGIYCGSFMLASNFAYRLVFLLLCLPQLFDWLELDRSGRNGTPYAAQSLLIGTMLALWLNGFRIVSSFLLPAQAIDWLLFGGFAVVLAINFLNSSLGVRFVAQPSAPRAPSHS